MDLAGLVRERRFREDLYYRLSVVPVRVPPLRERVDDIIPLARLFLSTFNAKYGLNRGIANAAFPLLVAHSWPGNVRELSNLIENLVVTVKGSLIEARDVAARLTSAGGPHSAGSSRLQDAREEAEKRLLSDGIAQGLSTRRLAEILGSSQPTVSRKIRKYFGDGSNQ